MERRENKEIQMYIRKVKIRESKEIDGKKRKQRNT